MSNDHDSRWLLVDSRVVYGDPDRAVVLLVGTCREVCREANLGTYGKDAIVCFPNGEPAMELFYTGRWEAPR